jgi:hypothetical protein
MDGALAAKFTDANVSGKYDLFYEVVEELEALRARLAELVCPECGSRVMDNGSCMLGHWCGKPLK